MLLAITADPVLSIKGNFAGVPLAAAQPAPSFNTVKLIVVLEGIPDAIKVTFSILQKDGMGLTVTIQEEVEATKGGTLTATRNFLFWLSKYENELLI
jgi:hypothetical protein